MRKHVKLSLLLLGAAQLAHASSGPANSHTFMWIRPPFQSEMPEKITLWYDRALARDCGVSGAFQIVPFGGQTTNSSDLGKYFMFCNKNELIVAEGDANITLPGNAAYNPNFRDVNAANFNIHTAGNTFQSTIKFRPRQSFAGVGLDYKQYLHRRDACEKKWWFEISTPIEWVRNDVRLTESITNPGGTPIANTNTSMAQAFKGQTPFVNQIGGSLIRTGSVWQFGKIDGSHSKTSAANIEVKIGYDYLCGECCHAEGYIGGLIPTGNKPNSEFVFEPIVGNNFHGAFMWGGSWGWEIWSSCDRYLHIEMATNGRFLFKNTQTRSFDVKYKPWSRYQLIYRNAAEAAAQVVSEGINIFTRKVEVRPRYQKSLHNALVYTHCGFQAEVGYNVWFKTAEKVRLDQPWEEGPVFANLNRQTGFSTGANEVNRAITIKETFGDALFAIGGVNSSLANVNIKQTDLDLESAATPCQITNIFFGTLGYRWDDWCYPVLIGVGGSYELSADLSAVSRYTIWGKFSVSI